MNPYQVLGVRKNASPKQITQAYRKKALETHPDRGGHADRFREVNLSYQVLSDGERRKKFDNTGTVDPQAIDNSMAMMMQIIQPAFMHVMGELAKNGGRKPYHVQLVHEIMTVIRQKQSQIEDADKGLSVVIADMEKTKGRTEKDDGFFDHMIDWTLGQMKRQREINVEQLKGIQDSLDFLGKCTFSPELWQAASRNGTSGLWTFAQISA